MYKFNLLILSIFLNVNIFAQNNTEKGIASFYADKYNGKITASGEIYYHNKYTAAHKSLPFNTKVKITNVLNNKSVVVRINDRGPFIAGRIIDLSKIAAKEIDIINSGVSEVSIQLINEMSDNPEPINQYYEIKVKKVTPSQYGIQIGSFTDMGNLLRAITKFNNNYTNPIVVYETKVNNATKYRLIVSGFISKDEAESFTNTINSNYKDCFTVKLLK